MCPRCFEDGLQYVNEIKFILCVAVRLKTASVYTRLLEISRWGRICFVRLSLCDLSVALPVLLPHDNVLTVFLSCGRLRYRISSKP